MSLDKLVNARRSVRGFIPDRPVPQEIIEQVLQLAQQSPSNCNVQPWRVWVLSGAARDAFSAAMCARLDAGDWGNPEDPIDTFPDDYRRLQIECGVEMYGKMGIARGDQEGRFRAHRRNYELFDAPHVAVVAMEKHFGLGVALDVGTWLQTFMLGLVEHGVSSCPQAALRHYPDVVREHTGMPDSLRILCGVSFGYEDAAVPANDVRQRREPLEHNVRFLR